MSVRRLRAASRRRRVIWLLVAVVAGALGACSRSAPAGKGDVALIVIDTLRADHLGLYGYERPTSPNLIALAKDAVTYTHAVTPGTWTVPSHGSLFTGRWPSFHGAERVAGDRILAHPLNPDAPTLAELLQKDGFHTGAFVGNATYVAPLFGFSRGFKEFFDKDLHNPKHLADAVKAWLPELRDRVFLFVNILDPHEPYDPPPPLDTMFPKKHPELGTMISTFAAEKRPQTPEAHEHFVSQYDGEIIFADQAVGEILGAFKKAGRYDDALIIITSDHGELIFEHGLAGHGLAPYEPEVHVPLVVKLPRSARGGEKVDKTVSTLGVFATVLETVGLPIPPGVQSKRFDEPHDVYVEDVDPNGTRLRVGYEGTHKIVVATTAAGATTTELYDLAADPGEAKPDRGPDGAPTLRAALTKFGGEARPVNAAPGAVIDPEREQKLRALGYVR